MELDKTTPRSARGLPTSQAAYPHENANTLVHHQQRDHLQVINDSLNSEPVTEQSMAEKRSTKKSRNSTFDEPVYGRMDNNQHTNSLENSLAGLSEIQAPAMMLHEIGGGWDSQLDIDQSLQNIDPVELNKI